MKSKILFITMLLFSAYSLKVKSQVGSLDVTFNPGTGASSLIYATAIQSDGKIIIGGDFTS